MAIVYASSKKPTFEEFREEGRKGGREGGPIAHVSHGSTETVLKDEPYINMISKCMKPRTLEARKQTHWIKPEVRQPRAAAGVGVGPEPLPHETM